MNNEFDQTIPVQEETPVVVTPIEEETNETVGFWSYLGLMVLFAIPVVGLVACIIFMFVPKRKSMKNYARAAFAWMALNLVTTITVVTMIINVIGRFALPTINEQFGTNIGNIFEVVDMANDFANGNYSAVVKQFREPLIEAVGEEYAPIIDEFATGKYDELIEQIKEKDYDDILEDLDEGEYRDLVEKIDDEDYNALRDELKAAANGQPSELFDGIQGYLNQFPIK